MKTVPLLCAIVLLMCPPSFSKCTFPRGSVRHCEEFQVGNQLQAITKTEIREKFWSGDYCECSLESATTTIKAIFSTPGKCPAVGSKVLGNCYPLCQDTGRWTKADFVFQQKDRNDCNMSHTARLHEMVKAAEGIKEGMARSEVENIFKELDHLNWQRKTAVYYEHPRVLIEVPYDEKYESVIGPARVFEGDSDGSSLANWSPFKRQ